MAIFISAVTDKKISGDVAKSTSGHGQPPRSNHDKV